MNEPRKFPMLTIKMPEKKDCLTLFRKEDHWSLRALVLVVSKLVELGKAFVPLGIAVVLAWKFIPW